MSASQVVAVDFETRKICPWPDFPPSPVSVSLKRPGQPAEFYAWAHASGNTTTREQVETILEDLWRDSNIQLLFHNSPFDLMVAERHLGLPLPPWQRIHDTRFLLFYHDPYSNDYSLKASAQRLLGIQPQERDWLREWCVTNLPEARRQPSQWAAHIAQAPGNLVEPYAAGDVIRTEQLFGYLYPYCVEHNLLRAYDRDRQLLPVLLRNSQEGIAVNLPLLERDYVIYSGARDKADNWLRRRLGLSPEANIDRDQLMTEAFQRAGVVRGFHLTPKSHRPSLAAQNLTPSMFLDTDVGSVFNYRNKLCTCLNTCFAPWLEQARRTNGVLHATWNQVRSEGGGARTGRMSTSEPSLLNLPKRWEKTTAGGWRHPQFLGVPPLPWMRRYLIAGKGYQWLRRDYNQQELRVLAHFEDGELLERYQANPWMDIHTETQRGLERLLHLKLPRENVKTIVFADLYGRGLPQLATALRVDLKQARQIRQAKDQLLPGVRRLNDNLKDYAAKGNPIVTWGGRRYHCEPPHYSKKYQREMSFEYRMLNYLVQSSAADITKQAIVNYDQHPRRSGRFLVAVHDELNVAGPAYNSGGRHEMEVLRESMESVPLDVALLTEGEYGPSWGELQPWRD
jgi:DNA polymerase I-like protein with 3'-5' exonuclease and polymerase domains